MNYTPYKGCKKSNISQGFHAGHKAVDFWFKNCYGTWLVAPENIKITAKVNGGIISDSLDGLDRGYGIRMQSISNPEREYVYWHCLPYFPVKIEDTILGGEEVAQIGNSGICYSEGILVALGDKLNSNHPGSHLHYEMYVNGQLVDPSLMIDWNKQPKGDFIKEMIIVLKKMLKL